MPDNDIVALVQAALEHHRAGRLPAAEALYRQALARNPEIADALHGLGLIALQVGQYAAAQELIGHAARLAPQRAEIHSNLGEAHRLAGRLADAMACYERALALAPGHAQAHNNLGIAWQAVAATEPARGPALERAVACFRRALELQPDYAAAHHNLGVVWLALQRFDDACASSRAALALQSDLADAWQNLAFAARARGEILEAVDCLRRAIALRPHEPQMHSDLLYVLQFHPDGDPARLAAEHRVWHERHAAPLAALAPPHANDRAPDRRLRVGYVSPDFFDHAESFFVLPLLEAHDHAGFEIHAYSSVRRPDAVTARFRQTVDVWHDVATLDDAALADKIRADRIDVLVDLTMHMASNRLLVFARRPAPVQVTWLAYPASTGLPAINYRFTDAFMEPASENDRFSAETPWRLPDSWCCYTAMTEAMLVAAPPAAANGHVTFGSLNECGKMNAGVIRRWAAVLRAVPTARLLLRAPEGVARERLRTAFGAEGVAAARLAFGAAQPRADYLRTYDRIDLALDPFPYNGITTTLDALWMGVPVLTLPGPMAPARAGFSLLTTAGLTECIATSEDDFVARAVALANNQPRLAELRRTLRERLQRSPLLDGPRFARQVETAYRAMWRAWCAQPA